MRTGYGGTHLPGWCPGGDLTPLEQEMVAAAGTGDLLDRGEGPFSLTVMQTLDLDRTIRAAVLRYLLVAGQWPVDVRGVRLRGVRISGSLDLEAAVLSRPLSLECCYLDADEGVCFDYATASRVALRGCQLAVLKGRMFTARELDLSHSTFAGPLQMSAADITGSFSCRGARLAGHDQDGDALVGDGIKVGGDVFLDGGFTAAGAVWLPGADITGQLSCRGAQLTGQNRGGDALVGDGMKVGGDVFLDRGFTAAGAVRLPGADITGKLNCRGAQLTGQNQSRNALVGDAMKVGAGVFLDGGFTAAGAVRLPGADITGQLNCRGARLTGQNQDGKALDASGMKVGGDVFLEREFTAAGAISLNSAHVGGSVSLRPTTLAGAGEVALTAAKVQIVGHLRWMPRQRVLGSVNLEGATVGQLDDDWSRDRANGYWPVGGLLNLDGLTYGRFGGDQQATVEQRLAWIRSQYKQPADSGSAIFGTQPYEQLAAVYRQAGQDDQARKVAIARRADPRKYGKLNPYRRFGNWFLDWTIKYGYQTWRAAVGLAAVFVVFLALSILAQRQGVMVPIGEIEGLHAVPSATQCTSEYPCFYPVAYTVDTVIPIINVHQADYWGPDGHAPWGWVWVGLTWVATAAGWALATLLVAGYTGLVRQD